ncbi:MAG: iron ABC transporter permease [Rhizobiaceae bacterium]|nr:iron ABC transporter permease [Rhizobiaceae bacterium]
MSSVATAPSPLSRLLSFWPIVTLVALATSTFLLLLPVYNIVGLSFSGQEGGAGIFENYIMFFSEPYYYRSLINSFIVSISAMVLALLIGVPAAYIVSRYDIVGRSLIKTAVVLTFVSPPFIGSYSWVVLLGRKGVLSQMFADVGISLPSIYGAPGIIFVFTLQFFPFVFLLVSSGLKSIDQSVEDAARNLGSGEGRTFFTVIAPLLLPSITTGALLVFIASFTDLGTPIILGERFRVLPVLIYGEFVNDFGGRPVLASTLAVLLLIVTTGALLLQRRLAARFSYATSAIRPLTLQSPGPLKRFLASVFIYGLVLLALLPMINIVISAFLKSNGPVLVAKFTLANFDKVWRMADGPLLNTVMFTTIATAMCAIMGTMIAYIIARRSGRISALLDTVVMFSYAVPGIVLGVGLVVTYHNPPLALTGTPLILILAYFIRRLPFSVRSSVSSLQQLSRDTEEASINLGAGPGRTFLKITVPLLSMAILSGALLTWSNTIRELSATLVLQSGSTTTISVEIFNEVANGNFGTASALGMTLIVLTFLPLLLLFTFLGKNEEALV